jgi:hypothetical protein
LNFLWLLSFFQEKESDKFKNEKAQFVERLTR